MTKEQQYFLHLVSSHLNNTTPEAPIDIDLSELFEVCELQNMTALAAIELKKLLKNGAIIKEQFSPFNQVLGLTLQNYEHKMQGITLLEEVLSKAEIKHLFVKGAAIRELYPVPEVRTSGDTDVIVEPENLDAAAKLLIDNGFKDEHITDIEHDMKYLGEFYELKCSIKTINDNVKEYLCDLFSSNVSENDGYTYSLKPFYNLLYITSHTLCHLKAGGVGVRQLADIDIILRNNDIDMDEYLALCEQLRISKSAKAILALCKEFFGTPIDLAYTIEHDLKELLEDIILNGGTFGYGIGNIGTRRLAATMHTSGSSDKSSSIMAVLGLFKADKEHLYHNYKYAREHHILLSVAYLSRLYDAVFKRGRQNLRHIKAMFTDREVASKISELLNELDIK